jgi:hypothetical protein
VLGLLQVGRLVLETAPEHACVDEEGFISSLASLIENLMNGTLPVHAEHMMADAVSKVFDLCR